MLFFELGIVLTLAAQVSAESTFSHPPCQAIRQQQNLNLPVNSNSSLTEIVHGASVTSGRDYAGAIYVTRANRVYLQPSSQRAAATKLAHDLGIENPGSIAKVDPDQLTRIIGKDYTISSCF
jgi:hypothetical protein